MKTISAKISSFIIIFIAGFLSAYLLDSKIRIHTKDVPETGEFVEHRQGQFNLINPLLECDIGEEAITNTLGISRFKIEDFINKQLEKKRADHISLYFRDLNNGPWIGVKEKDEFIGGSLLKIPLMIAYLKEAEYDSGLLDKKIKYDKTNPQVSIDQFFQPSKEIVLDKEYTVNELIEYMIKYSDNNAADLLGQNIGTEKILNVFLALGIGLPDFNKPYPISVRTYGSFFRILFNASYLSLEMSEKALGLLAQSEFNEGISKSIPPEIEVAHKFGIREIGDSTGKQLHDCGIIYYPKKPYLLCIMTRGDDFEELSELISDISAEIYNDIITSFSRRD